jgi:diadenosine tetraphosphate (Ap4A) HIT family hydrolase/8-oxo-dGTP pyrophosphatase MutT (NUDIX family)
MELTPDEQQVRYRDARFTKQYDGIWQDVGKCVFCDLKDKYILFEENGMALTITLYAYIDGHLMIVPRRHVRSPKELTDAEWDTVRRFQYIAKKLFKEVHGVKGMQLVQKDGAEAQSTVADHLHFHCVPFDAPDLLTWNYRQLKYTPLQNVTLYRRQAKKIAAYDSKYTAKYVGTSALQVVVDVIMINELDQVLVQERLPENAIGANNLTLPGGGVDNFEIPLQQELAREVLEETGAVVDPAAMTLVDSRIETVPASRRSKHLGVDYTITRRFVWNTYELRGFDSKTKLTPGDDAHALHWIDLADVPNHPRISAGVKAAIAKATA